MRVYVVERHFRGHLVSPFAVGEFIKSFCEEVGFKTVSIVNDVY